ncbi:MAG TPA: glycosyltransferase family 2 protein [Anaerolineae bacterium]|nr:glycosyltransferase family 2 protein [Anaerolineae bacterium]HQK14675.1 glycosyltransferase family 2 protein [Anaerolineae bacterium]
MLENQAQDKMPLAVSVVIPAYNEELGIGPVLEQLRGVLADAPFAYEIIVVDDGSQDDTAAVVRRYPDVRLITHKRNLGYGAALKTAIRQARYDLVGITDADGTYPNERIPELVAQFHAGEYDMVVGARTGAEVAIPWIRKPAKWIIGKLAEVIAGQPIPDINSGLRVFKRAVALRFFNMLPNGFSFTTTLTLGMLTNDYNVAYVPINYMTRTGKSKIRPLRDTLNFVNLILRMALYFAPLKIFLPLSGFLLFLGLLWGVFSWAVLKRLADVSTVVIVMAAVQIAVVGMLAELIDRRLPNYYRGEKE